LLREEEAEKKDWRTDTKSKYTLPNSERRMRVPAVDAFLVSSLITRLLLHKFFMDVYQSPPMKRVGAKPQ
jgi:hypothetical protein